MPEVAVLIPCYNEAVTIGKVVDDFRRALPDATVYVYDNNSTDATARIAQEHGAVVRHESRQGKGNVTRQMFREIEADCYVMVDGDDTYPAEAAPDLVALVLADEADMVVGDRLSNGSYAAENERAGHGFGNVLVRKLVNSLYHADIHDIMTGYRAFSRVFVKSYPVISSGFEVETEMSIHCLDKGFRIAQVPIDYRDRPEGSYSKLSTFSDGIVVLRTIATLAREYRPMLFFNVLALVALVCCLLCGIPVIGEYVATNYISHVPLAVAAAALGIVCLLLFMCGLLLDSLQRTAHQQFELLVVSLYGERASRSGTSGDVLGHNSGVRR